MRDDTQLLNNGLDSELDSYDTAEDIKRTDPVITEEEFIKLAGKDELL